MLSVDGLPREDDHGMELDALLDRVRTGDELAWEAFVRQYQGRVYGLACHYVGHAEDARDLAQEAFVHVYRHLAQLPGGEGLLPWIFCITRNACMDFFRRRKVRPPAWDIPVEEALHLAAPEASPEQAFLDRSRAALVHKALTGLTDLNREMILLKEIQGLSLAQIAEMLDLPLGTVKSRSNRARLELADALVSMGV
jgi:RNA polymerase sigma-70 factor (ECF subfamily)